ncbi:MAG: DUF192 domain-containing protein [Acidimicrobiia bacterium]|nr:DUF192 domain-containing protein [Acidimicrobiia bacterium]
MRDRRVTALERHAAVVELAGKGWRSGPVRLARTYRQRWRGLRPRPPGRGMLLAARSVHSMGMAVPLRVVSLDAAGQVRRVGLLPPGRLFVDWGASWIVELPVGHRPPAVGMQLEVRAGPVFSGSGGRHAGIHEAHHDQAPR